MSEIQVQDQAATYRQIRWTGMDILARREHSRRELRQKLLLRYPDSLSLIDDVIHHLAADLLQSDQRYTEAYVSMRRRKGYGPVRLQLELKEKGIEPALIEEELNRPCHDWGGQADVVLRKKFKEPKCDIKERAKKIRFLQYRGFRHDQIQQAIQLQLAIQLPL